MRQECLDTELSAAPREKVALRAKLEHERRVKLQEKSEARVAAAEAKFEEAEHKTTSSSTTCGVRQRVRGGHPRLIWSRILLDACRKKTEATRQDNNANVLWQQFQAFRTQLEHLISSVPGQRSHQSGRGQEKAEPKETGDVASKTKVELARKRSLDNFIDGEAKALDTSPGESRRKRYCAASRFMGDCPWRQPTKNKHMFFTAGPRVALDFFGPHVDTSVTSRWRSGRVLPGSSQAATHTRT